MPSNDPQFTEKNEYGYIALPPAASRSAHNLPLPVTSVLSLRLRHKTQQVVVLLFSILAFFGVLQFLHPTNAVLSASSSENCLNQPLLFPQLFSIKGGEVFKLTATQTHSIGPVAIYSKQLCFTPTKAPIHKNNETFALNFLHAPVFSKHIHVQYSGAPTAVLKSDNTKPVSNKATLLFTLTSRDSIFSYKLSSQNNEQDCTVVEHTVNCSLEKLQLSQGAAHTLFLTRNYRGDDTKTVLTTTVTTLDPVIITSSSIKNDEKVYHKPTFIELTSNKPLVNTSKIILTTTINNELRNVSATTTIEDTKITFALQEELIRNAVYDFNVAELKAEDGSELSEPFRLTFLTSGGPTVIATDAASYKLSRNPTITLTFDAPLDTSQNLSSYLSLRSGSVTLPSTTKISGNKVTIAPTTTLAACGDVTVTVLAGLKSTYGVGDGTAWSYATRTICQQTFNIGTSVLGRPLTAVRFGNGPATILYVGGTHGDEKSSVLTLEAYVDDLERNFRSIPSDKTIVVIPLLNPDGYAIGSRLNANGVDLNRNFPSNNWQTDVYLPGNILKPASGGTSPLSEPESSALASYVQTTQPKLILTYHAVARLVIANDSGDSMTKAQLYGTKSGYSSLSNSASHGAFEYDSTGEFEDWLHDAEDIPALLIELSTMSKNEFGTHKSAMWSML